MGAEIVSIGAGGGSWTAFKRVEVCAALNEAARSFSLTVAAEGGAGAAAWNFQAGAAVTIRFSGDLVFTGYVDRYQPQLHRHSAAEIHISGRGRGQDAVDCSCEHPTGRFDNQTLLQIANTLDKFGIGFSTDQPLTPIPFYQLAPGETLFRTLEKLARTDNVTLTGMPDGSIMFTNAGTAAHAPLYEGGNILAISADFNWAQRHSVVKVRGQRPRGTGKTNLQIEASAEDQSVNRYRPLLLVHDGDTDATRAQKHARRRRDKEAGRGIRAEIEVQGFRDDGGTVWTPGALVWCESPFCNLAQNLMIEKCTFTQERGRGSLTRLHLVDPQAYGGRGGGGGESGGAWDSGAGES